MSIELQATMDIGSVKAVTDALKIGAEVYGGDMVKATKKMTAKVVRSLVASTHISPKRRKVTELKKVKATRRDLQTYRVFGLFGKTGNKTAGVKLVQAKSKENAIRRHGIIGMRGLAKRTWTLATKKVSGVEVIAVPESQGDTARVGRKYAKGEGKFEKYDCYVKITNELAYIQHAMKGGGDQAASTILDRAARSFVADAERVAGKRLREAIA